MTTILITCPPMIKQLHRYGELLDGVEYYAPPVLQTLSETELIELVPKFDGWIIGDDPTTRRVLQAGKNGRLKVVVKWGVGTDNVDFDACHELGIPVTNTPGMFGKEVADIAVCYTIALARQLFHIDSQVKEGNWVKPTGISLEGKKVCLIGFGDIGKNVAKRLSASDVDLYVVDPFFKNEDNLSVKNTNLDTALLDADFVIVTCSLNRSTFHLLNEERILKCRRAVKIVNVSRGPIVDESAVIKLLEDGFIDSVAFDVFEQEPLSINNGLRKYKKNIFGTHNSSNTIEAVDRTSERAISWLLTKLGCRM